MTIAARKTHDTKLDAAVSKLDETSDVALTSLIAKLDALSKSLTAYQLSTGALAEQFFKERSADRVWWLLVLASVLAAMAHALEWI